ncbi:MAG: efflux RND transporter periplasmic adaptor subunit [Thiogranum sp.]|nr:efflux RND transporter periplasmic adaptor subunit [Thiogranum sp.]
MSRKSIILPLVLVVVAGLGWLIAERFIDEQSAGDAASSDNRRAPVEVADIQRGPIELRRLFTGTLNARAEFVVAPKIGGRVEDLLVDLGDRVERGQVVAELDDAEYVQAVRLAEAELAVAAANLAEARSQLALAERELQRLDRLRERGVSSESQLDLARADQSAKKALVEVSQAQVMRARAALETARIRLGYTRVSADWTGGNAERLVGARYLDEGETVAANAPLLQIVELDPLTAVFFVTERDYALLQVGQSAEIRTDIWPGEIFPGEIVRIAPVFQSSTRQAQVEVRVANPQRRLKPGIFARIALVLERVADAQIVPEQALVTRDGNRGLFVVTEEGAAVAWREVEVGIREGERVQVSGEVPGNRVVVLGQQLLRDGSQIVIAEAAEAVTQ